MSDKQLKDLLARLQTELENTDEVDSETLELVRELDVDINRLVESGSADDEFENVVARAQSMEARFAANHPAAEQFLREIINVLARIGI